MRDDYLRDRQIIKNEQMKDPELSYDNFDAKLNKIKWPRESRPC